MEMVLGLWKKIPAYWTWSELVFVFIVNGKRLCLGTRTNHYNVMRIV